MQDPGSTANDIDIHEPVAMKMKDLMQTSTRVIPANIALVAVRTIPTHCTSHTLFVLIYTVVAQNISVTMSVTERNIVGRDNGLIVA